LRKLDFSAREVLVLAPAAAANSLLAGKRCHTLVVEALLEDLGLGTSRFRLNRERSGR